MQEGFVLALRGGACFSISHPLRHFKATTCTGGKKFILLIDSDRPRLQKPFKTYLETLKWEVILHPRNSMILHRPIIICSFRWHMVWLRSSSTHKKTSKNGLILGWHHNMNSFTIMLFELYQKDEKKEAIFRIIHL